MGRHTTIAFCRAKNVVCFQADDNSWREKGVCGIDNVLQPTDIGNWVVASHAGHRKQPEGGHVWAAERKH